MNAAREAAGEDLDGVLAAIAASIRKIRAADEPTSVMEELVDAAPQFCRRAAMLLHGAGKLIGFRSAGEGQRPEPSDLEQLNFEVASAPALAHAVESRDTVVTSATRHNLSHPFCDRFAYGEDEQITVYPLILRSTVLAILIVDGAQVRAAAIEALILSAEAWIEALGSRHGSSANGDQVGN